MKMIPMKRLVTTAVAAITIFLCSHSQSALAAANMTPNYEIKFLLDSAQVLDENHALQAAYRNLFSIEKDPTTIGVLYLDTPNRDFNQEGWTNRIRIEDGADEFELTFKKRYSIENGDIDSALNQANQDGFDAKDTNYTAQIDWGYSRMTLSIANNKTKSSKSYDNLELPKRKDAIKILQDKIPGKEDNWLYKNWGSNMLDGCMKAGPVYYDKYRGYDGNIKLTIEVWTIDTNNNVSYITELSCKADTYEAAAAERTRLTDLCDSLGILLHEDSLKTQRILDSYLN